MPNKEKIGWLLSASVLVLLFLLSSTNLIIKEKEKEIYPISVIIDDKSDEFYANLRKGMDMAAEKYQVDLHFITLYEEKNQEQQLELLSREIKDGARAVILAPVDENSMTMALDESPAGCPIVLLGSLALNKAVAYSISPDMYEMGRVLAEKVAAREDPDIPICLFTEGLSYTGNKNLYDGLHSALEERGFTVRLVERAGKDTYRQVIEDTVYPVSSRMAVIALDPASLKETADIIEGSSVYREHVISLYGAGFTVGILNQLDREIIRGLMVYNQFDQGYLSVEKAVQAIQGIWPEKRREMEFFYIESEDLRLGTYEKLLYPME